MPLFSCCSMFFLYISYSIMSILCGIHFHPLSRLHLLCQHTGPSPWLFPGLDQWSLNQYSFQSLFPHTLAFACIKSFCLYCAPCLPGPQGSTHHLSNLYSYLRIPSNIISAISNLSWVSCCFLSQYLTWLVFMFVFMR